MKLTNLLTLLTLLSLLTACGDNEINTTEFVYIDRSVLTIKCNYDRGTLFFINVDQLIDYMSNDVETRDRCIMIDEHYAHEGISPCVPCERI